FVAERVVAADRRDLLVLEGRGDPFAERVGGLAARPAGADQVGRALPLGEVVGGTDREQRRHVSVDDVVPDGVPLGGQERRREQVHPVLFHHLARLRQG